MTQNLTIAIAQLNPTVGDLDGNCRKILDIWTNTKDDLIIFPECATCGYPPEDLILKPSFLDEIEKQIQALCEKTKSLKSWAIVPTPWREDGETYNAALLIGDGEIQGQTYKYDLPDFGVFDDTRIFTKGPLPEPLNCKGKKIGVLICEDMWIPAPAAALKDNGASVLIVVNASPFTMDKFDQRLAVAKDRVRETGLPLVYVNQLGGQDELVFDGRSFILDPQGNIATQMPFFDDSSIQDDPDALVYAALKRGLKDYVTKNGFPGVLIGLSGGIDSALCTAIAADALGPDKVSCMMMPSPFTSQDSLDDAQACADALGVSYQTIPIETAMSAFENTIPDLSGVAHENMQSRCRGLILMALSNQSGKMVVSTGNKSEMAVGYATLYGDMCGGFNPLKDVYKTQVYALACWRNSLSPVIPERILTKAPSAELKPDQTDQDSLPPYDVLDDILKGLIEEDLGLADIVRRGHDADTVRRVWSMLDRAEYKRRQAPPGVKITARAFGRDRRYPIINRFSAKD